MKIARFGFAFIIFITVVVFLPTDVSAQDDGRTKTPSLTWQDAVDPPAIRHQGDARIRWGWEDAADVLGPLSDRKYQVGDRFSFLLAEDEKYIHELRYVSEHAYFWFQRSSKVTFGEIETSANFFDNEIWYLDRFIYGSNATPGIDGDERIHIVHFDDGLGGYLGFFRPDDQCSTHICYDSNELDAIYIVTEQAPINSNTYYSTVAHEYQHLIQFYVDGNEYRWLDEAFSQFAEFLQGFGDEEVNQYNVREYLANPNHNLNSWSYYSNMSAHYGAGYIFVTYLYERFGLGFIQALSANPLGGLASVADTLQTEYNLSLDDVVIDWLIANDVDNITIGDGRYGYAFLNMPASPATIPLNRFKYESNDIYQYGADYLVFNQPGTYRVEFDGTVQTPLVDIEPKSGQWMWWSYNATGSATSLTRTLDLTTIDKATLEYSLWWAMGDFPGYFHVLASDDGGLTWQNLEGDNMQDASVDWYEYAQGPHYGGFSDEWIDDQIDLSSYAGQVIQIRFEYITNNALAGQGVVLDDIAIPELGIRDDVESLDEEWIVDGFLRTGQMVDQRWALAFVTHEDIPKINKVFVENGQAEITIEAPLKGVTIIVSPMAPFTQIMTNYTLELFPAKPQPN